MELSALIASVDILDYISQFAEFEEKNGEFWCLSPLKEEKTPSFAVQREKQQFYDFSTGKGGGIIRFIQLYHHCGFPRAVEILKQYAGVQGEIVHRGQDRPAAVEVARRFSQREKKRPKSRAKILPAHYMTRYEKRDDKLAIWENEGISRRSLDKFQVYYDRLGDRLVYPIRNLDGDIICVSGRTVDPAWKEKGLRKYTYYQSLGTLETLYGFSDNREEILRAHEIILFEGAKSVMKADTWGIHNTAALLTSHLSEFQMRALVKLGCNVVFALDEDVDARQDEHIRRLKRYVRVFLVQSQGILEEKMSPVDAGEDTWRRLYDARMWYR